MDVISSIFRSNNPSVFGFVSGFSMDKYVKSLIVADFSIQDAQLDNPSMMHVNTDAVSHELMDELKNLDGVDSVSGVYLNERNQEFNEENWAKIQKPEHLAVKHTEWANLP